MNPPPIKLNNLFFKHLSLSLFHKGQAKTDIDLHFGYPIETEIIHNGLQRCIYAYQTAQKTPLRSTNTVEIISSPLEVFTKNVCYFALLYNEGKLIENHLYKALINDEFILHYQPIFCIKTHKIKSVEALIRWNHPSKGLLTPQHFIKLAEDNGLIVPISQWVLKTACRQSTSWHMAGLPLEVSVNISQQHLLAPHFVETVERTLRETKCDPQYLGIEIKESLLSENLFKSNMLLKKLKNIGVKIIIDDFRVESASLAYLRMLPIDHVKVIASFIQEVLSEKFDTAVITTFIAAAHRLKIQVVAKGIETQEQYKIFEKLGFDETQGFYLSKPLTSDNVGFDSEPF